MSQPLTAPDTRQTPTTPAEANRPCLAPSTDLMILADGTVYARNLTPDLADLLVGLNPDDSSMSIRAGKTIADGRGSDPASRNGGSP